MKTFIFNHSNSSASLIISAENFQEADNKVDALVKDALGWIVEDEEGKDEE